MAIASFRRFPANREPKCVGNQSSSEMNNASIELFVGLRGRLSKTPQNWKGFTAVKLNLLIQNVYVLRFTIRVIFNEA